MRSEQNSDATRGAGEGKNNFTSPYASRVSPRAIGNFRARLRGSLALLSMLVAVSPFSLSNFPRTTHFSTGNTILETKKL